MQLHRSQTQSVMKTLNQRKRALITLVLTMQTLLSHTLPRAARLRAGPGL
jgi:hypothetical protein